VTAPAAVRPSSAKAWVWVLGGLAVLSTVATIPLSVLADQNVDGLIALVIALPAVFTARLQAAVDLDSVQADLAAAVQAALEPAHVSVWTAAAER
jgi:sorbitol-specific phosphotransferase system component IIBC